MTRLAGYWVLTALLGSIYCVVGLRQAVTLQDSNVSPTEIEALQDLYIATDGDKWSWRSVAEFGNLWNFTSSANPCAELWQGVNCSAASVTDGLHIRSLDLNQYGLNGTLPETLGQLGWLQTLSLDENYLSGSIPSQPWATLPNLTALSLSQNDIYGNIPADLGLLSGLTVLDLSGNRLHGEMPPSLMTLTALTRLSLHNNRFVGSLPDSLAQLTLLESLQLCENRLTGTVPASLGVLASLRELSLCSNALHGSLPDSLGDLTNLTSLQLDFNDLSGTIPSSLGQLSNLVVLDLWRNSLTGTIPDALGALPALQFLQLHNNNLNGTIPKSLCNITTLVDLFLDRNALTGQVPTCLGYLSSLRLLMVDSNRLTGPIPASLSQLPVLSILSLYENALTGTVPSWVCTQASLEGLYLHSNHLTGTLPACLGYAPQLHTIDLSYNDLHGSLPDSLTSILGLENLWVSQSHLTGSIPCLRLQSNLTELYMDRNHFTGTIPDCFAGLNKVEVLTSGSNYLHGTVPASLGEMVSMQLFGLENNYLTGSIPSTFADLPVMLEFYVGTNFLSGSLDRVFSAATQLRLSDVVVSQNAFTGTLPGDLFRMQHLNTFIADGNCFAGTLSPDICHSAKLVSLILDGLHTAPACRTTLLPATHSYVATGGFHGTIPSCMLYMPRLVSLHLSGNGLTGTLPGSDNSSFSALLVDLTVSHNALSGTIPASVQTHSWRNLDLSFNPLCGAVHRGFGNALVQSLHERNDKVYNKTGSTLALRNNRLSGQIPSPLVHLQNVSMLGSNMFACKIDKSDLPRHDNDRENYQCGSDAFDGPFFLVLALACALILCIVSVRYVPRVRQSLAAHCAQLQLWRSVLSNASPNLSRMLTLGDLICQLGTVCAILVVVVLVPWYAAASHYYGTYTSQYAWVVSAAFLSGVTPALTELVLYCALLVVFAGGCAYIARENRAFEAAVAQATSQTHKIGSAYNVHLLLAYAAVLTVNIVVVAGVNAGFVAIALTQSSGLLIFAQVLLSLFKLGWNSACLPPLLDAAKAYLARHSVTRTLAQLQVFITLFNNIAVPCLVVAVLSPSCLYNMFEAAPVVTSNIVVQDCYVGADAVFCTYLVPVVLTSVYSPPFTYSYQCSSSFVTYYAPAFVYLALSAAVITPLLQAVCLRLLRRTPQWDWWTRLLRYMVPSILLFSDSDRGGADKEVHYDANGYIVTLTSYLGILFTFGVVFPPLAAVMAATMVSVAWQNKLALGRFLYCAKQHDALASAALSIEQGCAGAVTAERLRGCMYLLVCFACCFYALFLFDTLGDAVGASGAYWVLIVMPLIPLVLLVAVYVRNILRGDAVPVVLKGPVSVDAVELGSAVQMHEIDKAASAESGSDNTTYNVMLTT